MDLTTTGYPAPPTGESFSKLAPPPLEAATVAAAVPAAPAAPPAAAPAAPPAVPPATPAPPAADEHGRRILATSIRDPMIMLDGTRLPGIEGYEEVVCPLGGYKRRKIGAVGWRYVCVHKKER